MATSGTKHVAVLKGGWSVEREVSLVSGRDCAEGLRESGYKVTEIDVGRDIASVLRDLKVDVAFNALHGRWGEDGCIQGILEVLEIPYTHSGVLASSLAMDKEKSKSVFQQNGIPCAESRVLPRKDAAAGHALKPPYVIKPVNEGSSIGVFMVREGDNRPPDALVDPKWPYGELVMAEKYIPGRELTVAVMNSKPLTITEIDPQASFYDYESKYEEGGSNHLLPADVPKAISDKALDYAKRAHEVLGCRGVTRADFRYDNTQGNERLIILEINTQPGMTPTSLVPEQAAHIGMSFSELMTWMVEDASCGR